MKKICAFLLFVMIGLVSGLTGCFGNEKSIAQIKPICPEWAVPMYGQRCESTSLDITPDDFISLVEWQIGQIQLNDSFVDDVYGVEFFKTDGTQLEPRDMEQGVFYSFRKTTATAAFHIWPNQNYGPLSSDTHVLLAKP